MQPQKHGAVGLIHASSILNSWLDYENIICIFVLNKIFSLTAPATNFLQNYALNILDAVESVRASKVKIEKAKQLLNTYIQEAEEFIKKTNIWLLNDREIVGLDCNCCIKLPAKDEKVVIDTKITNIFREFIAVLLNEIDRRILLKFDDSESVYYEISMLDPRTAEKMFAEDENKVRLDKLCKLNNIKNVNAAISELKKITSEYLLNQNRRQFEVVFNNNFFIRFRK